MKTIVIPQFYRGPSGQKGLYNRQEVGLARAFAALGCRAVVLYPEPGAKAPRIETPEPNVKICYMPAVAFGVQAFYKSWQILLDEHADAVHVMGDNSLGVPGLYRFCQKHGILFYSQLGALKSTSNHAAVRRVMDLLLRRNLAVYRKTPTYAKTPAVAAELESLGVPWTCVFGNHDEEVIAFYKKDRLGDYYESLKHCFFRKGDKNLTGIGNHYFRLETSDGKLVTMLMMVDSNSYLGKSFFSGFDVIHDDQIDWYENIIKENSPAGTIVPSLAFFHIPPKEFKEGWEKCYRGDPEATYRLGFVGEKDNYFGYAKTKDGNFFRRMVELGSCKGMFMGHDHLNTLSIDYKGIRLTYGMSIDYLAYVAALGNIPTAKCRTQRGGTLIDVNDDGTFEVSMLPLTDIEAAESGKNN